MVQSTHDIWYNRLHSAALLGLSEQTKAVLQSNCDELAIRDFIASFKDNQGHRRAVDAPFLSRHFSVSMADNATQSIASRNDLNLWNQAATLSPNHDVVSSIVSEDPTWLALSARQIGIEVWTQSELCALHALSWLGPRYEKRAFAAATNLILELQPDNATNHPWGVHLFAHMECTTGDRDAGMYAESLLHNCMASSAIPDHFSALILLDAAKWIKSRPYE